MLSVYANGNLSASSSTHEAAVGTSASSGGGHVTPPDLPPLPLLPSVMPMAPQPQPAFGAAPVPMMHHPHHLPPPPSHHVPASAFHPLPPDASRPAPLGGRRSPVRGYSRSPSPPPSGDDSYGGRRHHRAPPPRRGSYRDSSPEGNRSRYDSGRYERYSRERSPDR